MHSLIVEGWYFSNFRTCARGEGHLEAGRGWLYREGKSGGGSSEHLPEEPDFWAGFYKAIQELAAYH